MLTASSSTPSVALLRIWHAMDSEFHVALLDRRNEARPGFPRMECLAGAHWKLVVAAHPPQKPGKPAQLQSCTWMTKVNKNDRALK
mmetsp:Transcript_125781/g.242388  ORF Transcript_125781/g.242388 Transcript_125781/m.242388 type:complete len:86 (+) Transcript_125781:1397-1654(+)